MLLLALGAYVAVACVLMLFPGHLPPTGQPPLPNATIPFGRADAPGLRQNPNAAEQPKSAAVFVASNGVHTDLVLPLQGRSVDWRDIFAAVDFPTAPVDATHVAIGWGDRAFYLQTPTWADLTVRVALTALAGTGSTVLHVTWLRDDQLQGWANTPGHLWRLPAYPAQLQQLEAFVLDSLAARRSPAELARPVAGAHYGTQDAFYEAAGHYGPFETCNTWTGRALRQAGFAVAPWTPFDFNVTWSLPPAKR